MSDLQVFPMYGQDQTTNMQSSPKSPYDLYLDLMKRCIAQHVYFLPELQAYVLRN